MLSFALGFRVHPANVGLDISSMNLIQIAIGAARDLAALPRLIKQRKYSTHCEEAIFFSTFAPGCRGFYVDVGANHPKFGSNTYRLYRQGWSGLVIEPNPEFAQTFRLLRPRDKFVCEDVSPEEGTLTYFTFNNSVHNTFSPDRADQMTRWGEKVVSTKLVNTRPLTAIIESFCPEIHSALPRGIAPRIADIFANVAYRSSAAVHGVDDRFGHE
jgi:hypothetical protein